MKERDILCERDSAWVRMRVCARVEERERGRERERERDRGQSLSLHTLSLSMLCRSSSSPLLLSRAHSHTPSLPLLSLSFSCSLVFLISLRTAALVMKVFSSHRRLEEHWFLLRYHGPKKRLNIYLKNHVDRAKKLAWHKDTDFNKKTRKADILMSSLQTLCCSGVVHKLFGGMRPGAWGCDLCVTAGAAPSTRFKSEV